LTVIGPNNDLREYSDPRDLINDFVAFKLAILQERIDLMIKNYIELDRWLTVKIEFILAVLDEKITFKNKTRDNVKEQILKHTSARDSDTQRLLQLNLLNLTSEQVAANKKEIKENKIALTYWKKTTPNE